MAGEAVLPAMRLQPLVPCHPGRSGAAHGAMGPTRAMATGGPCGSPAIQPHRGRIHPPLSPQPLAKAGEWQTLLRAQLRPNRQPQQQLGSTSGRVGGHLDAHAISELDLTLSTGLIWGDDLPGIAATTSDQSAVFIQQENHISYSFSAGSLGSSW
jgi:hypothetical protein